ncbi:MAG TPA: tRNA (adenosine(37)-N6)-threonylcarbamoyltransferase complex dimerization subunit type 1 TsaB [Gemmatimonadales bacterium]|jgi:tRNA threonylcarbamoyladenosine biosynthesis protein TsaB
MWLAIDTATDQASVALGHSRDDAVEENLAGARRHAGALVPMIDRLLRRRRLSLSQLSGLAMSDGPGSFTGLRVGAAAMKALSQARGLPLWVAPSLLVRAAGQAGEGKLVLTLAYALRGEIYAAAYRFVGDRIMSQLPPTVTRPEALSSAIPRPDLLVGDAPADLTLPLEAWIGRSMIRPPDGAPSARQLIGLIGRPGGAREIADVEQWEPLYGRPAEAQARWETAHGRPLPDSVGSSS